MTVEEEQKKVTIMRGLLKAIVLSREYEKKLDDTVKRLSVTCDALKSIVIKQLVKPGKGEIFWRLKQQKDLLDFIFMHIHVYVTNEKKWDMRQKQATIDKVIVAIEKFKDLSEEIMKYDEAQVKMAA